MAGESDGSAESREIGMSGDPRNWKRIAQREVFAAPPHLAIRRETVELPDGRRVDDFYTVSFQDFVNVFAETEDGRVLLLRQYKHGPGRVGLTFPGGHIEAGEPPLEAAWREVLEETGHAAARLRRLGPWVTNANRGCNHAWLYLAEGCRRVAEPDSGDLEAMELVLLSRPALLEAAGRGEFAIADHVLALALATNPELLSRLAGPWEAPAPECCQRLMASRK
jgi:ADP-ribose pyrophosphatase